MITRGVAFWSQVRRCFSPSEWFVRWLRLPKAEPATRDRGLVMIQIDGLSRQQLERAMDDGRMPFLKSLLRREHYKVHDFYSGLPASTPSVQGELFYGEKCAVPAFGFRDHRTGEVVRMFARDIAADVEDRISYKERGVLAGGSAYCNIYGGGADDVHFCASSMGWAELMQNVSGWKMVPILFWHFWSILRVAGLLAVEFVLACFSFVKGAITKQEYWQELLMIPARVVVVILMRELAIIGATMDVTRGVPIVQLNLLGYDEQAHRRGPKSKFAHWTLKGIDRAMSRLWRTAHWSARREYDVWVYSDHGQVTTTPFEYVTGEQIAEAASDVVLAVCDQQTKGGDSGAAMAKLSLVAVIGGSGGGAASTGVAEVSKTFGQRGGAGRPDGLSCEHTAKPHSLLPDESTDTRASWLSTGWIVSKLFGEGMHDLQGGVGGVQVAALGPLGLIYTNRELSTDQSIEIAARLVNQRGVPLAFVAAAGKVWGINPTGQFDLERQPERIFGSDHPFLAEIASDTIRLCRHQDAGDVVVSGWVRNGESLSFAVQNGAHAGPSPEETGAFVMAPLDVHLDNEKGYLRPNDLRLAVQRFLHPEHSKLANNSWTAPYRHLRIMTYNVHGCVGMDHRLDTRRIARVISQSHADVVALQELDVSRARSGFRDQAQEIARLLEMECQFHPAWRLEEESYGNAILSRVPMRLVRKGPLPSKSERYEPRGAIWAELEPEPGLSVQVINTHLSLYPSERKQQANALAADWVRPAKECGTTIVCGDFNAQPSSPAYRRLHQLARDVQSYGARGKPSPTFFSPRPLARIDHVFVTDDIGVKDARVPDSRLARVASDHLPLVADLVLPNS